MSTDTDVERRFSEDAADLAASIGSLGARPLLSPAPQQRTWQARWGLGGVARRTLGFALLMLTVFLWTLYNFLTSYIFSNHTYDKPFFIVYVNASFFSLALVPRFARHLFRHGVRGLRTDLKRIWHEGRHGLGAKKPTEEDEIGERLLVDEGPNSERAPSEDKLTSRETAVLSFEFSMIWFLANYFASACLEYTSVASVTILTSTSSVWTLIFCAAFRIETFTARKLCGVLASLAGIALVSTVDLTGGDEDNGSFPDKTTAQVAVGDAMAFFSAVLYGVYVTVMKVRVGDEERVDMQLFFGLVGLFNFVLLWPLFFILHWTGIEPFELPPSGKIWTIVLVNSIGSIVSDISWAYAMLLTTPLVVTVGLSLTIPLSLVGQMVQYGQYSSWIYWMGAAVVLLSFVFISKDS